MKRPAVFFDRDNTLIVSDGYLGDPDGVVLVEGAAQLVARVRRLGYAAITFSNQSGVARGLFTEQDVHRVNSRLDELLLDHEAGAVIDRHEFCPHHPDAVVPRYRQASEFRKPSPGMIYQAARQLGLDLGRSWVVGDAARDIEAGRAAGCRTILFKNPALPTSPAARETLSVEPDFVAASLSEVGDLIENNPPGEEAEPTPAAAESEGGADEGVEPGGSQEAASTAQDRGLPAAAIKEAGPEDHGKTSTTDDAAAAEQPVLEDPEQTSSTDVVSATDVPEMAAAVITGSQEQEQTAAGPVDPAVFEEPAAVPEPGPPQPAQEQIMDDRSAREPTPASEDDLDRTVRRRSPPAVILAAKAAREAARNSAPDASAEVLREVARNAAREAAMGITRDYSAAPADVVSAEPGPDPDVETGDAPLQDSQPASPEARVEPTAETPRYAEPAQPLSADQPEEMGAAPAGNLHRLEDLAEQILLELRRRNDAGADFSVSKLMAGITMVISLAVLVYAYLYKDNLPVLQNVLLLGLMLQSITISLLLMGRQK